MIEREMTMRDDLIERLNEAWRKLYGDGDEHDVCDTLAEAAAALEAAREDAERYQWVRDYWHDLCTATGMTDRGYGVTEVFVGVGEHEPYAEGTLDAAIDAAIDQARGKGVE